MSQFLENIAKRIPEGIRKIIIEKNMIDTASNSDVPGTPMEYLFDVYAEFLDGNGEYSNWLCPSCRQHVLNDFKKLKEYL